jgi:hypothetical protein
MYLMTMINQNNKHGMIHDSNLHKHIEIMVLSNRYTSPGIYSPEITCTTNQIEFLNRDEVI